MTAIRKRGSKRMAGEKPMSAQETTIATLQQQLHSENQRRFEQIEKNQDNQQKLLNMILANTAMLPQLKQDVEGLNVKVDDMEAAHNRLKGGTGTLGAVVGAWEIIRFVMFKH